MSLIFKSLGVDFIDIYRLPRSVASLPLRTSSNTGQMQKQTWTEEQKSLYVYTRVFAVIGITEPRRSFVFFKDTIKELSLPGDIKMDAVIYFIWTTLLTKVSLSISLKSTRFTVLVKKAATRELIDPKTHLVFYKIKHYAFSFLL